MKLCHGAQIFLLIILKLKWPTKAPPEQMTRIGSQLEFTNQNYIIFSQCFLLTHPSPPFPLKTLKALWFSDVLRGGGAKGNTGKESVNDWKLQLFPLLRMQMWYISRAEELGRSQKHIQGYFRETSFLNSSWFYMNTSNVDKEIIY